MSFHIGQAVEYATVSTMKFGQPIIFGVWRVSIDLDLICGFNMALVLGP